MEWDCTGTIPAPFLTLNIEYMNINLIVFQKKKRDFFGYVYCFVRL